MPQRICDVQEQDRLLLEQFMVEVRALAGMAVEIFEDHPSYLLSPVCRGQFVDKAKQVEGLRMRLTDHLVTDNPCTPL